MSDERLSGDVATVLRERLGAEEPASGPDPQEVLRLGRTRLRRRRVAAGALVTVTVLAIGAVTGLVAGRDRVPPPAAPADPPTYPAAALPGNLEQVVADNVPTGLELPEPVTVGLDASGAALPPRFRSKASSFSTTYRLDGDVLSLSSSHARGEAEGDGRSFCRDLLGGDLAVSCTAGTNARGEKTLTWVWALSRDGDGWRVRKPGAVRADRMWFARTAKVVRSRTLVGQASETVRAPSPAKADALWRVPVTSLTAMAEDDRLGFAPPPKDPSNGCDWTLPNRRSEFSCEDTQATPAP